MIQGPKHPHWPLHYCLHVTVKVAMLIYIKLDKGSQRWRKHICCFSISALPTSLALRFYWQERLMWPHLNASALGIIIPADSQQQFQTMREGTLIWMDSCRICHIVHILISLKGNIWQFLNKLNRITM